MTSPAALEELQCRSMNRVCFLCFSPHWGDLMEICSGSCVRNEAGWHVSGVINEQVFRVVLSKWSHYWWPPELPISDDSQALAGCEGACCVVILTHCLGGMATLSAKAGLSWGAWTDDLKAGSSAGTGAQWVDWLRFGAVTVLSADNLPQPWGRRRVKREPTDFTNHGLNVASDRATLWSSVYLA